MNFNILKNNKGITLMELVIVLAIISIIGAILAPNFTSTTDKARLRSDIQSTMVIQNAIDLYRIETGRSINGSTKDILSRLSQHGYLGTNAQTLSPQTEKAFWTVQSGKVRLNLSNTSISEDMINNLNSNEILFITRIS